MGWNQASRSCHIPIHHGTLRHLHHTEANKIAYSHLLFYQRVQRSVRCHCPGLGYGHGLSLALVVLAAKLATLWHGRTNAVSTSPLSAHHHALSVSFIFVCISHDGTSSRNSTGLQDTWIKRVGIFEVAVLR